MRSLHRGLIYMGLLLLLLGARGVHAQTTLPIRSKAAILIDAHTGQVLYEHNAHEALPPASVTKVMTLLLALEAVAEGRAKLDDLVHTSAYAASMGGTQIWLEPGEQMPLKEILYAIAVGSANDAAVALAEHLGGSEAGFVEMMNRRAAELGARNTQFQNPSGLPPASLGQAGPHVTSAYDMAMISRHALTLPMFHELTSTWGPVVMRPETLQKPVLWSFNTLLRSYPGMDGIKTGMTSEAGFCLSATAVRDGLRLIAVTLGAATRTERDDDIRRLLDYGFSRMKAVKIAEKGAQMAEVKLLKGEKTHLPLVAAGDFYLSMEKDAQAQPETTVEYVRKPTAPIAEGETLAYLVAHIDGREAGRIALVAPEAVPRASVWRLIGRYFSTMLSVGKAPPTM